MPTQQVERDAAAGPRADMGRAARQDPVEQGHRPPGRRRFGAAGVVFGSDVSAALTRDEPTAIPRMRVIQGGNATEVVFR